MSFRKSIDNKSSNVKKPFCKVCQDAGKPESEYTSHFVRSRPDKNGKTTVTCPILAATECRYCFQLGHTTKFCPVIEENNKRYKKQEPEAAKAEKMPSKTKESRKPSGAFDVLADDSDDEKPVPNNKISQKVVDEFPALVESIGPAAKPSNASLKPVTAVSWAAMAEKPVEKPAAKPLGIVAKPLIRPASNVNIKTLNWADDDTSSDEEEEISKPGLVRSLSTYHPAVDDDDW